MVGSRKYIPMSVSNKNKIFRVSYKNMMYKTAVDVGLMRFTKRNLYKCDMAVKMFHVCD